MITKKPFTPRALTGAAALLLLGLAPLTDASAQQTFNLTFTSATPGTLTDANGNGTGFTSRLSGTRAPAGNDSWFALNTAGVPPSLNITTAPNSSPSHIVDFNLQRNVGDIEAPGIQLSSLGFTGAQNFVLDATFTVPVNGAQGVAQFGLIVGTASNSNLRTGYIGNGGGTNRYAVTNQGAPENATIIPDAIAVPVGTLYHITLTRTAGVYAETVNGVPFAVDASFLNSATDLTAGVYAFDEYGSPFTLPLDSFSVTVVPEPSTWAMLLGGAGLLGVVQRACRARRA